jgi:hypothetical protein
MGHVPTNKENTMSLVTPDFSDIKDTVSPGTYTVIVKKGDVKEWPNGGTYVNWELETIGETETKNNGRRIFAKTSTGGKGAFMLQQIYRAATGADLKGPFDTEQLLGKTIAVELVDGVRNGEPTGYTEVKRFKSMQS